MELVVDRLQEVRRLASEVGMYLGEISKTLALSNLIQRGSNTCIDLPEQSAQFLRALAQLLDRCTDLWPQASDRTCLKTNGLQRTFYRKAELSADLCVRFANWAGGRNFKQMEMLCDAQLLVLAGGR